MFKMDHGTCYKQVQMRKSGKKVVSTKMKWYFYKKNLENLRTSMDCAFNFLWIYYAKKGKFFRKISEDISEINRGIKNEDDGEIM